MPATALDASYQAALARLRANTAAAIEKAWNALPAYDRENVAAFVNRAVPTVGAAQTHAVRLTDAYLARATGGQILGLNVDELVGAAVRNGADPADVYARPFVTVWMALKEGTPWVNAVASGLARATATSQTDVALSTRAAAVDYASRDPRIVGWERVPDDIACDFCLLASTQQYGSQDLMPLHDRCGCTVSPITGDDDRAGQSVLNRDLLDELGAKGVKVYDGGEVRTYGGGGDPAGMVVREHGELGPVITKAGDDFTGPDDI